MNMKKTSKLWRKKTVNYGEKTQMSMCKQFGGKFLYIFGFINKYESKNLFVYKSNALFYYLLTLA